MDWDGCHAVAGGKRHAHHAVFADREKAEEVRFELTRPLRAYRFSRPAHSAALPLLRSNNSAVFAGNASGKNHRVAVLAHAFHQHRLVSPEKVDYASAVETGQETARGEPRRAAGERR